MPGRVSVVMPCYDVESYIDEALTSLRRQTHRDLQIIVVDDGSSDSTVDKVRRHAAADPRITVLEQVHAGQGAARNLAIALADGEFLTFMDADDVVPRRAYETMVRTLTGSGSDFCLGHVRRFDSRGTWTSAWASETHASAHTAVTLAQRPVMIKDIIACNRMYRRDFWDSSVRSFPEGTVYEDHVPMLRAFLHAARFDVLTDVTYRWRAREDGTSTGQQKADLTNLKARVAVKADAWRVLLAEGDDIVRAAWLGRVLDVDLPAFYGPALEATTEYRDLLSSTVATYLTLADEASLTLVRAHMGVAGWLVAQGRWDDVATVRERTAPGGAARDAVIQGPDAVLDTARIPVDLADVTPRSLLRLTAHQSRATAVVHDAYASGGNLVLLGVARLHGVASNAVLEIGLAPDLPGTVELLDVGTISETAPPGSIGFRATVPRPPDGGSCTLALRVQAGELIRHAPLRRTGRQREAATVMNLGGGRGITLADGPDGLVVTDTPRA